MADPQSPPTSPDVEPSPADSSTLLLIPTNQDEQEPLLLHQIRRDDEPTKTSVATTLRSMLRDCTIIFVSLRQYCNVKFFLHLLWKNLGFIIASALIVVAFVLLWALVSDWNAMSWQAWLTLAVVVAMVLVLLKEVTHPAVVVMAADLALLTCGVITDDEAFEGFGNSSVATIAIMLIVSEGVK